jgi:hypothetical protein
MKMGMSIILCAAGLLFNQTFLVADQSTKRNLAFYQEKAKQSGSAWLLAVAKKTAIDALKGTAYGAVGGVACGIPGIRSFPMARLAYTYYNPPIYEDIVLYGPRPKGYTNEEWVQANEEASVKPWYYASANKRLEQDFDIKKHGVVDSCIFGGIVGASLGAIYSLYKQRRSFSPAWATQIEDFKETEFAANPVVLGQKPYLVSSEFFDTSTAQSGTHHEIYLMPQTVDLKEVFRAVVSVLKKFSNDVAFVALRLNPNVEYYGGRILPRIIVGLKDGIDVNSADAVLTAIYTATNAFIGLGMQPRYSSEINKMIYTAFGSADYKDQPSQSEFARGPWYWRTSNEEMAYRLGQQRLSLGGQ